MRNTRWMLAMPIAGLLLLSACGGDGGSGQAGGSGAFPIIIPSCDRQVVTENDEPSREVIIGQQPDLVVSYSGLEVPPEDLEAAGIDLITPSWRCNTQPADFDGIFRTLEFYGQLFGTEGVANQAVADLRRRVGAVEAQFGSTAERTAANVYVAENRLSVYGRPSMSNVVLETLGLRNVFADVDQRLADVSIKELLARNPDVILLTFGGSETQIKNGGDAQRALRGMVPPDRLTAVVEERVTPINFTYLVGDRSPSTDSRSLPAVSNGWSSDLAPD